MATRTKKLGCFMRFCEQYSGDKCLSKAKIPTSHSRREPEELICSPSDSIQEQPPKAVDNSLIRGLFQMKANGSLSSWLSEDKWWYTIVASLGNKLVGSESRNRL